MTDFTVDTRYRWVNESNGRIYEAIAQKDLFGDWIVERFAGGIKKSLSRKSMSVFESKDHAISALRKVHHDRKTHTANGYKLVESFI